MAVKYAAVSKYIARFLCIIVCSWSSEMVTLQAIGYAHCASVHQAAKLVAALLRVAGVTAGPAESNGSLLSGL